MADTEVEETTTPEPGSPEALALGHAEGQAILHGAKAPRATKDVSGEPAVAGPYKLICREWNELISAPGTALRNFRKHKRGDVVELDSPTAERLLRAGAVAPTTREQAQSDAAQEPTTLDKAMAINDQVGPQEIKALPEQTPS